MALDETAAREPDEPASRSCAEKLPDHGSESRTSAVPRSDGGAQ